MSSELTLSKENIKNKSRKIPSHMDNPIDNVMIEISECISPFFNKIGFTPNGLTTLSLIFGLAGLYHLYKRELIPFTIYALLYYLFDIMDGYYARKYDMVSDIGDKYDHFKDLILVLIGIYILYDRYNILDYPVIILVALVLCILGIMYTGCQEKLIKENKYTSNSLQVFNIITPSTKDCYKYIGILRWFGSGTLIILLICLVWYLNSQIGQETTGEVLDINKPVEVFNLQKMFYQNPSSNYFFSHI
jgi:phosphatidylglycerophosphate synthase